ncbi:MAG: c-type cytochrome [Gammaproteobacteria bacterium]|nr:c-type cytochrome [Gammaproteobacteria bacterium]
MSVRYRRGRELYNTHCYFCHGYAGDARTVASRYLTPPPRAFTASDPRALGRQRMIEAVRHGKPGTAMMPFAGILPAQDIATVVDFVRRAFMDGRDGNTRYHIAANGWDDHQRYAPAFPFVSGTLAVDTAADQLDAGQQAGLQLFMASCVTCHEGRSSGKTGLVFEPAVVSYPRAGYAAQPARTQHVDALTAATPYARHDAAPVIAGLSPQQRRGEQLFQHNCAFCHGADGSGKNWIGTFLQPHPRDLRDPAFMQTMTQQTLQQRIHDGLPGTTMPAWGPVLDAQQIAAVAAYVERLYQASASALKDNAAELTQ